MANNFGGAWAPRPIGVYAYGWRCQKCRLCDCIMIKNDLNAIGESSEGNKLPISIDKCVFVLYRLLNSMLEYSIRGDIFKNTAQCLDLGVIKTDDFR